jgi:hypothetical protein
MPDAFFNERKNGIEKDKVRMGKWLRPPISDRIVLLQDLIRTVNHMLAYLAEINQTLSDDDGLLDELAEELRALTVSKNS